MPFDDSSDPYADIARPVQAAKSASDDPYADIAHPAKSAEPAPKAAPLDLNPGANLPAGMTPTDAANRAFATPRGVQAFSTQPKQADADRALQAAGQGSEFFSRPAAQATVAPMSMEQEIEQQNAVNRFGNVTDARVRAPLSQANPHPAVDLRDPTQKKMDEGDAQATQFVDRHVNEPFREVGQGAQDVFTQTDAERRANGGLFSSGTGASMTDAEHREAEAKHLSGLTKMIAGGGSIAITLDAPELLSMGGAAVSGDIAAQVAMAKVGAGFAAGYGASAAAGVAANKLNFTPEAKDLLQTVAFFTPSLFGLGAGKEHFEEQGGNQAYVAGAGPVGVGAAKSPEGYSYGVRMGDKSVSVNIPRTPPDPATVTAQNLISDSQNVMRTQAKAEAAAGDIVNGASPEQAVAAQQPKGPDFTPPDMKQGELSQDTVNKIATVIRMMPEADRPQAMLEAHGKLAEWISQQGKFVGPDGQVQIVKTPQQAQTLAAKLVNDEIARHDAASQPKQEEGGAKGVKEGGTAAGENDPLYQRAKTVLATQPQDLLSKDERVGPALLQRHLGVDAGAAGALWNQYKADQAANVGSSAERVVEERPETIDAQMEALRAGTIKAVMLPEGSSYEPKLDKGMKKVVVSGDAPGAGTYIIKGISPDTVKEAAKAGTHGDLLGHVQTKEEIAEGGHSVAVVASKPDGTEIQASEVNNPEAAQRQAEILAERHPGADISVKPIDDVIQQRMDSPEVKAEKLPKDLAGAKPRYGYRDGNFTLKFDDHRDLASYVTQQAIKNKRHDDYSSYLDREFAGQDDFRKQHGVFVRRAVAEAARQEYQSGKTSGDIAIPSLVNMMLDEQEEGRRAEPLSPIPGPASQAPAPAVDQPTTGAEDPYADIATGGEKNAANPKAAANASSFASDGESTPAERKTGVIHEPYEAGPRVEGIDGKATAVDTPDEKLQARYRLVPLEKLRTSHNAMSFAPRPNYPKRVQERDYTTTEGKMKVIENAQDFNPSYHVNNNPDATNGAPIVLPDGVVAGGNGRAMTLGRILKGDGREGAWDGEPSEDSKGVMQPSYRKTLEEHASFFGFTRKQVEDNPTHVLIRELEKTPQTMDELERLVSVLNKDTKAKLSPNEEAVSVGRKLTPDAMDAVSRMIDRTGADASIRAMLRDYGAETLHEFQKSGALTEAEVRGYAPGDEISDAGKDLVERALRGRIVGSVQLMDALPPSILNKLDGILAAVTNLSAEHDEYDLTPLVRKALEQQAEIAKRKTDTVTFQKQGGLLEQRVVTPAVDALSAKFAEKAADVKRAFRAFAEEAKDSRIGQVSLMGGVKEPFEAFNEWFGSKLTAAEYAHELKGTKLEAAADGEAKSPVVKEPIYKFGNTQAHVPEGSAADKAVDALRAKVNDADLAGDGKNIDENHVTVRYGIRGDDIDGIREFLRKQTPFEARLGPTAMFEPSEGSDGAAVIQAPVESPEFHHLNAEIEKHGDFEPSSHPEYKPHVTVAYVKPEAAKKYVGLKDAAGATFPVDSIAISDRYGNKEEVRLEGKAGTDQPVQGGSEKAVAAPGDFQPKKDDHIRYRTKDGQEKTGRYKAAFGENSVRIAPDGGGKPDVVARRSILGPVEAGGGDTAEAGTLSGAPERGQSAGESAPAGRGDSSAVVPAEVAKPEKTLADRLFDEIQAGRMPADNPALRKLVTQLDGKLATDARLKEAQEAMEVALVRKAREIVAQGEGEARPTFDKLVALYNSQPNLNVRTSTSIENQAYSTPAPLAFVASELAGITKKAKVYEPTAGNGMLLIGADPRKVTANELDPARIAALKSHGFGTVLEGDALKAEIRPKSVDAVVSNPPFGSVKGADGKPEKVRVDGYKIGQLDALIVARALDAMKDDGRATLIMGAQREPGGVSTDDRNFFNWLYSHYRVASHFEVDGKLYARQGANWPVRVVSIDGRARSDNFSPNPGDIQRVTTWKEVYERFSDGLAAFSERDSSTGDGGAVPAGREGTSDVAGSDEPKQVRDTSARPAAVPSRGEPGSSEGLVDGKPGAQPEPLPDSDVESAPGLALTDDDVRPDADVSRSDRLPQGESREVARERAARPAGADRGTGSLDAPDTQFQVQYSPASSKKDVGVLVPTNMRDPLAQAMRELQDKVGDLDEYVAGKLGYDNVEQLHDAFMGLQVDSVAAAIHEIENGGAVVIADQTGIGKGRQAAAIQMYAVKQGKIPVFMTVGPKMFTDMYCEDLAPIGGADKVQPFIVNADGAIFLPNGKAAFGNTKARHKATLQGIVASGKLPAGRNAVWLTYSQINTDNIQRQVLQTLAPNAVFILDESHNAAGESSTGEFMQSVLAEAHGVTFLSATYAKRPDNMPLYARTDMGIAIKDKAKLETAMQMGGLPLQTVVSNNLVKAGQMFRRERSYEGVNIDEITATEKSKEHRELADRVTEALRAITTADRSFHEIYVPQRQKMAKGEAVRGGGNAADVSLQHTEFAAVVHNSVAQLLLGLKADPSADRAIAALKRGEKPVIAVEKTMGSFLTEYAAENGLSDGDVLKKFDYRTILNRSLERSRALRYTDKQGNETKIPVRLDELDDATRIMYNRAQDTIDALNVDIPMSPIDWMRYRITQAGYKIAEITGRTLAVDYSNPDKPTLSKVPQDEVSLEGKNLTTRGFQGGSIDAVILNVAGATGISLHAKHDVADRRPRRMIVAQAAQDINIFMQMLGRINRTGQVVNPNYDLMGVDLPAEKRPNAMLSKKMKSLNANTSSNTESATSVKSQDMLNKYGDEIVAAYLEENPSLARMLNVDPFLENETPTPDIARKATGRLAIMPVAVQEEFYRDVEKQYEKYITFLNDSNQNDLEPRTYDFAAKPGPSKVIVQGQIPSSPFGQDAVYNEFSIKAQSKPLEAKDVQGMMDKSLEGKTPAAHLQGLLTSMDADYNKWYATLDPTLPSTGTAAIVRQSTMNFLKSHAIGSTLRMEVNGDVFSAAVTGIETSHSGKGNPFSMSKINVGLATTGSAPILNPPATKLMKAEIATNLGIRPQALFEGHRPPARETAKIITGNLLGAYGELTGTKGTIINFTREDGTVEQGILLPKKFELADNTMGDQILETPAQVLKFLRGYSKPDEMQMIGAASRDGDVRVVAKGSGIEIQTPKAKARGGKFFLDHALTDITGDFTSSGNLMRVTVPAAKAEAALGVLLKKASVYAIRSMAEEARKIIAGPAVKPSAGTTLNASLFGADIAAKALGTVVKRAWDKDVAPHLPGLGKNVKEATATIVNALVPTFNANRDVLDSLMRLKGDQERAMFHLDNAFSGIERMFDSLPESERIDFLDRYKRGEDQKTPELDKIASMYQALDTATYQRIVDAQVGAMDRATRKIWDKLNGAEREAFYDELTTTKSFEQPGDRETARDMGATLEERKDARKRITLQRIADGVLSFKQNHLRAFWKVIPGSLEEKSAPRGRKSPLRGDRGFTRRSTLPDVSSGIAEGGVLETTNPQKMLEMGQKSALRYITALNMWKELGDLGMRKFVSMGERPPDGWERIDDAIAKVFYPVRIMTDDFAKLPEFVEKSELGTRMAVIQGGEWYLEQSSARLLNNYLSKSWFQTNAIGRGLMAFKNVTTGIELGLSPFHLFFEGIEAVGSQFGLGMMQSWNNGLRHLDPQAFLQGLGEMATAPAAPIMTAKLGGKAIKMEKQGLQAFAADPDNQRFLRAFPNAPHLVDLLFTGGITMAQPREYRVDLLENARASFKDGNYIGAIFRAFPGLAKAAMNPLFEKYIPRLKMGFALQALSHQLLEHADAIGRGDVTEAEVARSVVDSTENRFGELNFSNLWWNNTLKGVNQLAFRSVTWKLGNWRGATSGAAGQAKAFADPIRTMIEDAKGERKGKDRHASEYIPKIDLNMSWLIGTAVTTAVMATVISKLMSGKWPWEWAEDDKGEGMSEAGALVTEFTHPRIGGVDGYTGKPVRVSLPTGLRDFEHAYGDPRGYVRGSLSGFTGKMLDTWENRDFAGNYVYDPNGTEYQKLARILRYNEPLPIAGQQLVKTLHKSGARALDVVTGKQTPGEFLRRAKESDLQEFEAGLLGLSKSSTMLDMSPLEKHMEEIRRSKKIPQTPEEQEAYREKMAEVMDGGLSPKERHAEMKEFNKPYLLRLFGKLNYVEARKAMELASPEERNMLMPALLRKRRAAVSRSSAAEVAAEDQEN